MKKKKIFPMGFLILLFTLTGLQSCKDNDDDIYYTNQSYAIGNMVVKEGEAPYLKLDSKKTMLLSNPSIPSLFLEDGRRVMVNFSLLQDNYMGYDYYIAINDIDTVLVKNVIPITPETADSIGNDPVDVINMWTSDEYLTIQFEMKGAGDKKHMVNLVQDFSLAENPDKDGYMQLEFRHNTEGDRDIERYMWGVASFKLKDFSPSESGLSGLKIKINTFAGTKTFTCKYEKDQKSLETISPTIKQQSSSMHLK